MSATFKKGQTVNYRTPRGRSGTGKIVEINQTSKGDWYKVESKDGNGATVRLSGLSAA